MLLMIITIASLLAAVGTSLYAWRLAQDVRDRSAARVAALATDIDSTELPDPLPSHVRRDAVGSADSAGGSLFASAEPERTAWLRVAPAILAGVLIVGGLVAVVVTFSDGASTASAAANADPRPLELLSLRHDMKGDTVSITGLVRNPAGNADLERLNAVVFLFDDKGAFLASGRAPLDFTTLSSGEESPFVVSLTSPPGVARYRVSFRRNEGGMLPHIDRREANVP